MGTAGGMAGGDRARVAYKPGAAILNADGFMWRKLGGQHVVNVLGSPSVQVSGLVSSQKG